MEGIKQQYKKFLTDKINQCKEEEVLLLADL